jgi:hypothetical protein
MLWADIDAGARNGILMAVVGALGTAFGLFINWLRDRDKLRYDSKLQALEAQNALQASQIAALTRRSEDCEAKHRACEEGHKTMELRVAQIEAALCEHK